MDKQELFENVVKVCSNRNFHDLPISKDILRLVSKIHLIENGQEVPIISSANSGQGNIPAVFSLLKTLGKHIQGIDVDAASFSSKVNLNDYESLSDWIVSNFGETNAICRVLGSCHQSLINLTLSTLKSKLTKMNPKLNLKDHRGNWHIFIKMTTDETSGRLKSLSSIHKRGEIAYERSEDGGDHIQYFVFEWSIETIYDVTTTSTTGNERLPIELKAIDLKIENIRYDDPALMNNSNQNNGSNSASVGGMDRLQVGKNYARILSDLFLNRVQSITASSHDETSLNHDDAPIRSSRGLRILLVSVVSVLLLYFYFANSTPFDNIHNVRGNDVGQAEQHQESSSGIVKSESAASSSASAMPTTPNASPSVVIPTRN